MHQRRLHPRVGWVTRRSDGCPDLTPLRSRTFLQGRGTLRGGGSEGVWPKRAQFRSGDQKEAMVYHWMLHRP